jgi:hypothetical protein
MVICDKNLGREHVSLSCTVYHYILPRLRQLVTDLSSRGSWFNRRSVYVGFVVDKVTLGYVFFLIFWLYLVSIVPPYLLTCFTHLSPTLLDPA